jgi:hypothetical protein
VGENDHLDALDGHYWMQLEWRALSRALSSSCAARAAAISDALAFRRAQTEGSDSNHYPPNN